MEGSGKILLKKPFGPWISGYYTTIVAEAAFWALFSNMSKGKIIWK
jgi:hypothetical protein